MNELARRIQEELVHRNLTKRRASADAGLSPTTIQNLLDTKRGTIPDPDTVTKLAMFFEWPVEEAFRWAGLLPARQTNPLAELKHVLTSGPWDIEDRQAIYRIAYRLAVAHAGSYADEDLAAPTAPLQLNSPY